MLGKKAMMLVPEISLTPQMLDRFISRFGKDRIAIVHSKLSSGERFDHWNKIKAGEIDIIIGARSAIFAPVEDLGIIIIDEEHDNSYKSESNPKYNTKEVAEYIGEQNNIPVVFGSATPDIAMYYNIKSENVNNVLVLKKRANASSLPSVEIVDLREELANGNRSMLSKALYEGIETNIQNKYQTILFLNRRGYSTFVMCRDCGHVVKCKHCDISLTYHSGQEKLKCHYCGYEEALASSCPECKSNKIKYFGTGTQKVETEVRNIFKGVKTIRMDVDTVSKKNSHEEILGRFKNENIDILVGTQMVVKGHHFPKVTLVGVMAADGTLNVDDYRASEKTFQILTQVAGRAGRENLPGKVVVQTYNPENFAIICAKEHNYEKFYETEILLRKQLKYPPFCDIILISFVGENNQEILDVSKFVYEYLNNNMDKDEFNIFKPMPAPIAMIQNKIRWRMIIKGNLTEKENVVLNNCLDKAYETNMRYTNISIDINPNNMM